MTKSLKYLMAAVMAGIFGLSITACSADYDGFDSNDAELIGTCKVIDDVTTTGGALVGTNNGTIYACYYTGTTRAVSIVGSNNTDGKTVGCYVANDYSIITNKDVDTLNNELETLYKQNSNLTPYEYVYSVGTFPIVRKK
jgi:hypothetical protein